MNIGGVKSFFLWESVTLGLPAAVFPTLLGKPTMVREKETAQKEEPEESDQTPPIVFELPDPAMSEATLHC